MKAFSALVFDDRVENATVYTEPEFNQLLAVADVLEIVATITMISSSGGPAVLTVRVQVSPDEENWKNKSATPEINAVALTADVQNIVSGKSSASDVTSAFSRLEIFLGDFAPHAQVRIRVTGRGERALGLAYGPDRLEFPAVSNTIPFPAASLPWQSTTTSVAVTRPAPNVALSTVSFARAPVALASESPAASVARRIWTPGSRRDLRRRGR